MDAVKCINSRRSIRKYKSKKVPASIVRKLITAGMNAPSSYNDQPWEFIIVKNKKSMKRIVEHKGEFSKYMINAPVWICCGYNDDKSRTKLGLENTALAIENLLLAAHALGLGAVYTGAYDTNNPLLEKKIRKVLSVPEKVHIVAIVCLGWPDEKPCKKRMRTLKSMIHSERF